MRNPSAPMEQHGGPFALQMRSSPRATVTFRPYGAAAEPAENQGETGRNGGLHWILRADPWALLEARLPRLVRRAKALGQGAVAYSNRGDTATAQALTTRASCVYLGGLIMLASEQAGEDPGPAIEHLMQEPMEALRDRLTDLARRLPPCPTLPAMAVVEPATGRARPAHAWSTDPLAVLWVITHINGRTFVRDAPSPLGPSLTPGDAWDVYTP